MLAKNGPSVGAMETRWLQGIREALAGHHQLIHWADNAFASFLDLFDVITLQGAQAGRTGDLSRMKDGAIYLCSVPDMVRLHAERRTSHVLITPLNENWGAFCTTVPHRTADWGVWEHHLVKAGCRLELVRRYLDDPAVKAVIATNHTVLWHPTIMSLPIGIACPQASLEPFVHGDRPPKTQDLLINNSGWAHRARINQRVAANFGGRIRNTYGLSHSDYCRSITQSRFVLCPSGFGWDTYRLWETLTLGSIPIVEYSAGWHTLLDDLPVLFVTNFDEVTPALLARAYPAVLARCGRFDFGKLTKAWWASRIAGRLQTC